MSKDYWAWLERGSEEYGQECLRVFEEQQAKYRQSELWQSTRQALAMYLNRDPMTGASRLGYDIGMSSSLPVVPINEFRQIIEQVVRMLLDAFKELVPVAVNADSASARGALISSFLLRAERKRPDLQSELRTWVLHSALMGDAFFVTRWNPRAGNVVGVEGETTVYEGGPAYKTIDRTVAAILGNPDSPTAVMYVEYVDRFELAAQHPGFEEQIAAAPGIPTAWDEVASMFDDSQSDDDTLVPVLWVMHAQRPHVPAGRMSLVLGDGTVIADLYGEMDGFTGGLSTKDIPIRRLAQANQLRGWQPHAVTHELIITSRLVMAAAAKVAQKMKSSRTITYIPDTARYSVDQLRNDAVVRGAASDMPKVIELAAPTDADHANYTFFKELGMQAAVVAEASRGVSNGDSGVQSNLLTKAQASYAAGYVQRAADGFSGVGYDIIQLYSRHAEHARLVTMVGLSNSTEAMSFIGDDLAGVRGVEVANTDSDNFELAEKLVTMGIIEKDDWSRIIAVARGGLTYATEANASDDVLITEENERLQNGDGEIVVMPSDSHLDHMRMHLDKLSSNEVRFDPEARNRVLEHCKVHMLALTADNPQFAGNAAWLWVTKQKPIPSMQTLIQQAQQAGAPTSEEEPAGAGGAAGLGKAIEGKTGDDERMPSLPGKPRDLAPKQMQGGPVQPQADRSGGLGK